MKRFVIYFLGLMLVFSGCKSNEKAYNVAFQKLKEKNEENTLAERAKTATTMSDEAVVQRMDAKNSETAEVVTILQGKEKDLSVYNIVIKSFINRTNAYSLYSRMKDAGYPAVLVQNKEQMYRIIIESCKYQVDANRFLEEARKSWPDAWILVRR